MFLTKNFNFFANAHYNLNMRSQQLINEFNFDRRRPQIFL